MLIQHLAPAVGQPQSQPPLVVAESARAFLNYLPHIVPSLIVSLSQCLALMLLAMEHHLHLFQQVSYGFIIYGNYQFLMDGYVHLSFI